MKNLETKVKQRTTELSESEARFRNLVDGLPKIAVQGYDEERKVTYWNQASEALYGYSRDEAVGRKMEELILPGSIKDDVIASFQENLAGSEQMAPAERILAHKDGSEVPVYSAQVLLDSSKGERRIYSVDLDLTDLKLAQAMEQRTESFYLQLFNHSSSGVAVYEPLEDGSDFIIKGMNPAGLRISKVSLEDVLGKKVREVFPGIVEMGLFEVFQRVHATGTPEPLLSKIYVDGQISFWVDNYIYQVPSGELVAVFDDVTERKQAEEQLLRKTNEWEKTFDAISDVIMIQDENRKIIRANRATFNLFQMEPGELLGSTCHSLFRGCSEPCQECPVGREENSGIVAHQLLGKVFHVSLSPFPVADANYFVYVVKDVTEQQKLEDKLSQAQKMEAIGSLAGGIAHDFNNILTAIVGFAELAKLNLPKTSPALDDIVEILAAADRATALVQQILTYSRKKEHQAQKISPYRLITETLRMVHSTFPSTAEIVLDLDENCGEIWADPTNLHQIIMNLCTNALHAIEEQKGTITIRLYSQDIVGDERRMNRSSNPTDSYVVLSISDTGCGMTQSTISRIFDPYFTTKRVGKGSGMGLAVVHGITQTLNGFIEVESSLGEGTTLKVYIPKLPEESDQDEDTKDLQIENESKVIDASTRVYVVDDEDVLVKILKRQLEGCGYRVSTFTDPREALEKILSEPDQVDLLITDQTMPKLSGVELSLAVLKVRSELPIIMCTGHSDVVSKEDVLALGIKRFVLKPIFGDQLITAIREVLGLR